MSEPFSRRDLYRILQVDPGAHPEVVRAAHRTLLRVLGRHPDLGGSHDEAATLNEAYETLGNVARRRAYDLWLAAHGTAPAPVPPLLPSSVMSVWIRIVLADHRVSPKAPFARSFDYVLEGPGALAPRVYVKHYPALTPERWPTMFMLSQAVAVARKGLMPSTDVVLFAAERAEQASTFLTQAARHSAGTIWNRCLVALCTWPPPRLQVDRSTRVPAALRRLQEAAAREPVG